MSGIHFWGVLKLHSCIYVYSLKWELYTHLELSKQNTEKRFTYLIKYWNQLLFDCACRMIHIWIVLHDNLTYSTMFIAYICTCSIMFIADICTYSIMFSADICTCSIALLYNISNTNVLGLAWTSIESCSYSYESALNVCHYTTTHG